MNSGFIVTIITTNVDIKVRCVCLLKITKDTCPPGILDTGKPFDFDTPISPNVAILV